MARSSRPSTSKKPSRTPDARAKANAAAGYLKRRAKAPAARVEDVYELVEQDSRRGRGKGKKPRRETTELEYDFGEDGAEGDRGGFDDDEEDDEEGGTAPRLIGEGDTIASEDDEEIDSDAAFEDVDGDADGFAGVFGRKKAPKKKRAVRFADVDLNEDEDMAGAEADSDDEGDLDSDTYIDILDVLDGKGEVYNEDSDAEAERPAPRPIPLRDSAPALDDDEDLNSDEDDEQEVSGDEDEDSAEVDSDKDVSGDDSDDPDTSLHALHALISGLPSTSSTTSAKRKAPLDGASEAPRKKRAVGPALKERTQAGAEGEFRVGSTAAQKLDLAALAAGMPGVLKSLLPATSTNSKDGKKTKAKAQAKGALAAPLPLRTQARVDREAAYAATKDEVDKWAPSMKRIREAEHLSFPLQAPAQQLGRVSSAGLAAGFEPRTEMETAVARLLSSAHLAQDADVQRTENTLLAATLDPAEVARRRADLRRLRELAFRGEVKARRVAKIKSKVYRKIARGRKERGRDAEAEGEGEGDDAMQMEVDRARARAGMRVKRDAKWNRARVEAEGEEGLDGEGDAEGVLGGRRAMEVELERGERLARLIRGEDGEGDGASDSDEEGGDGRAFDELRALAVDRGGEGEEEGTQKGVLGMKFMRDAIARRANEAGREADDFVREMGRVQRGGSDDEDGDGDEDGEGGAGVMVRRTGGRVVYQPGEVTTRGAQIQPRPPSPTRAASPAPAPARQSHSRSLLSASSAAAASDTPNANPWLAPAAAGGPKAPRAKNAVVVSKDSGAADRARHRLAKDKDAAQLGAGRGPAAVDDGVVEVEMGRVLGDGDKDADGAQQKQKKKGKGKASKTGAADEEDDDDDANSEVDAQEAALARKGQKGKGPKAFEQRDLVARAFAGDNVVRDFEDAKRREIASDAPRAVDTTLAGWGAWGGPSTRKRAPRPHLVKQVAGIAPTDRADHGRAHVIISEKRDKKAAKYQVKDLPYPFTSRAQYERSMEAPLGAEWNTRVGFQKGTLPRVVKKMGMVIEPLAKLS
ncbi:Utp14-domain-containing protein [Mycena vulgaris]|nr:Utp14-domain-containing protein [Mycena vulgaris]